MSTPGRRLKFLMPALLAVYWTGLIVLSSLPGKSVPSIGRVDKAVHFGAFFILGVLIVLAVRSLKGSAPPGGRLLFWAFVVILIYAALDEWHQDWIPGRNASIADWTADLLGAAAGILVPGLKKR